MKVVGRRYVLIVLRSMRIVEFYSFNLKYVRAFACMEIFVKMIEFIRELSSFIIFVRVLVNRKRILKGFF